MMPYLLFWLVEVRDGRPSISSRSAVSLPAAMWRGMGRAFDSAATLVITTFLL